MDGILVVFLEDQSVTGFYTEENTGHRTKLGIPEDVQNTLYSSGFNFQCLYHESRNVSYRNTNFSNTEIEITEIPKYKLHNYRNTKNK